MRLRILNKELLMLFVLSLILNACSTYEKAVSTHDAEVDFSNYRTFAWIQDQDTLNETNVILNNAKNFTIHCLSQRGIMVNTNLPDLLIYLDVKSNHEKEYYRSVSTDTDPNYYLNHPQYYPYYYPNWHEYIYSDSKFDNPPFLQTTDSITFVEQYIRLIAIDRKTTNEVWRAHVTGDIYEPIYLNHDVHPGIHRLIETFPVKPIKELNRKELKEFSRDYYSESKEGIR